MLVFGILDGGDALRPRIEGAMGWSVANGGREVDSRMESTENSPGTVHLQR